MELPVVRYTGENTGKTVKLPAEVFGITPKDHAIYLDVKHILANQRQGTHKTKEKGEITASTRKIKKQKGTGGARAGSIKSPLFRGGGRIFGPKPRDYEFKLNKKVKQLARKSALSYKAIEQNIIVVEDFSFEQPKTKHYVNMLQKLALSDSKTLLVLADNDQNVILSGRNLPRTKVTLVAGLNTYDVLNANKLLLSERALKILEEKLA